MIYTEKGLKICVPERFKLKWDYNYFEIKERKTKDYLSFTLEVESWTMDYACDLCLFSPKKAKEASPYLEILRIGEYDVFPSARESLIKQPLYPATGGLIPETFIYKWNLVIPFENRIVSISVYTRDFNAIDNIWKPIIDSIEFKPSEFLACQEAELRAEAAKAKNIKWAKASDSNQPKHFKHTFSPPFSFLALYDSNLEYDSSILLSLDAETASAGAMKDNGQITLLTRDALDVIADFYLNTDAPDTKASKWSQIIEGIIAINSGKMSVNTGESAEVEILMAGNYEFRIYFEAMKPTREALNLRLYFWKTEEPETNVIKIIKQSKELFPVMDAEPAIF